MSSSQVIPKLRQCCVLSQLCNIQLNTISNPSKLKRGVQSGKREISQDHPTQTIENDGVIYRPGHILFVFTAKAEEMNFNRMKGKSSFAHQGKNLDEPDNPMHAQGKYAGLSTGRYLFDKKLPTLNRVGSRHNLGSATKSWVEIQQLGERNPFFKCFLYK